VPTEMTAAALAEHLDVNGIDLDCSRVLAEPDAGPPVAFALIARRDHEAWVGGMGTAPGFRGRGLGEHVLRAGVDAARERGCGAVWLEVITTNTPAIALYEKHGFRRVRDLAVWSLPPRPEVGSAARAVSAGDAHAWIAAHRQCREPWQRADPVLERHLARGTDVHGLDVERDGATVAAVLLRSQGETASVVQIAAVDERAAIEALAAAVAGHEDLRVSNVPVDDRLSGALASLGAGELSSQHELCLRLSGAVPDRCCA
jgi:predicted N-acetyltransferase YhbS